MWIFLVCDRTLRTSVALNVLIVKTVDSLTKQHLQLTYIHEHQNDDRNRSGHHSVSTYFYFWSAFRQKSSLNIEQLLGKFK